MATSDPRIYLTGTGGQGTLTATRLLAQAALDANVQVVAGEVHGMAQRGGVVESAVLLGGWRALRLDYGEADILLGFEALETLRGLPYLKQGGIVFSSDEEIPPLDVCLGNATYPEPDEIKSEVAKKAVQSFFIPCKAIGVEAGNVRAGATALLGALVASGLLPFGIDALASAIESLPERLQAANLAAMRIGAATFINQNPGGFKNA